MADVGIRVTVEGADQAKQQLEGVNKAIADSGESANKASQSLSGLGTALPGVGNALDDLNSKAVLVGGALGTLAATVGVAFGTQLLESVKATADLGDRLSELSQRTGVSVESLSGGLRLAAETSGSSIEAMATGMDRLNRAIADAADGSGKSADAFGRLGISVTDANGNLKSSDEILREIADKFSRAEDGALKTEIAMTLLGRAGANLIPMLNQGSEGLLELERAAKLAGIQMSGETAQAADQLNDNLRILSAFGEGFMQGIATPIINGLRGITEAMRLAAIQGASTGEALWEGWKRFLGESGVFGGGAAGGAQSQLDLNQTRMASVLKQMDAAGGIVDPTMRGHRMASLQGDLDKLITDSARLAELANVQNRFESTGRSAFLTGSSAGPEFNIPLPGLGDERSGNFVGPVMPRQTRRAGAGGRAVRERSIDDVMTSHAGDMVSYYSGLVQSGEMTKEQYAEVMRGLEEGYAGYERARVRVAGEASKTIQQYLLEDERQQQQRDEQRRREALAGVSANRKAQEDIQRDNERTAQLEIKAINDTAFLFKEQKIAALEEVRQKYDSMGEDGARALRRIDQEIEQVSSSTRAAGVIIQDVGFNMDAVWKGVHGSLTATIAETSKWLLGMDSSIRSLGDATKGFAMGVADAIINAFAKMAADEIFIWFKNLFSPGGAGGAAAGGGGGLGGLISGAVDWIGGLFGGSGGSSNANEGAIGTGAGGAVGGLGLLGTVAAGAKTFLGGLFDGGSAAAGAAGAAAGGSSLFLPGSMDTASSALGGSASGLSDVLGVSEWLGGSITDAVTGGGGILSGIGGVISDVSNSISNIGSSIGIGGAAMPLIGGAIQALSGNVAGGAGSAIGGILGAAGGPIGSLVGSFIGGKLGGMFGDDEFYPTLTSYRIQGTLGPGGFRGNVTPIDEFGNTMGPPTDGRNAFASTSLDLGRMWSQKLPGVSDRIPVDQLVPVAPFRGALQERENMDDESENYRATRGRTRSVDSTSTLRLGAGQDLMIRLMDELASARGFASGGEGIFTSRSMITVGEVGPERVTVQPLAGAPSRLATGGTTIQIQGMSLMDSYSTRRMFYELQRMQDR